MQDKNPVVCLLVVIIILFWLMYRVKKCLNHLNFHVEPKKKISTKQFYVWGHISSLCSCSIPKFCSGRCQCQVISKCLYCVQPKKQWKENKKDFVFSATNRKMRKNYQKKIKAERERVCFETNKQEVDHGVLETMIYKHKMNKWHRPSSLSTLTTP